jgi:hypothetical protein
MFRNFISPPPYNDTKLIGNLLVSLEMRLKSAKIQNLMSSKKFDVNSGKARLRIYKRGQSNPIGW